MTAITSSYDPPQLWSQHRLLPVFRSDVFGWDYVQWARADQYNSSILSPLPWSDNHVATTKCSVNHSDSADACNQAPAGISKAGIVKCFAHGTNQCHDIWTSALFSQDCCSGDSILDMISHTSNGSVCRSLSLQIMSVQVVISSR